MMNQQLRAAAPKVIWKCVLDLSCELSHMMELMEEVVLAHQVGADPLHIHELFVLLAAAGGGLLAALQVYAYRYRRLVKLWFLLARREFFRAGERIRHHH